MHAKLQMTYLGITNISATISMCFERLENSKYKTHILHWATYGVSTQLQSSGLVAHENSTFRNLALAVFGPFMALMGALFDSKCTCDSTLVYMCQADAEKCIFVWTILSQTPRGTPQVTSDAGRISARIF